MGQQGDADARQQRTLPCQVSRHVRSRRAQAAGDELDSHFLLQKMRRW
jgi:hypothetical protein